MQRQSISESPSRWICFHPPHSASRQCRPSPATHSFDKQPEKLEVALFFPPIPAVTNQVCCCGTIKKQVKGIFLISDKVQRLQKQSWMIHDAKASIYSQNKGKSQILKTSEYFNQLQKSHWYYFPHLKKGKYKLRNVKGSYWFFSDGFSGNSNRNASVAQKCPNTHHLSLIWRFTNLICK